MLFFISLKASWKVPTQTLFSALLFDENKVKIINFLERVLTELYQGIKTYNVIKPASHIPFNAIPIAECFLISSTNCTNIPTFPESILLT